VRDNYYVSEGIPGAQSLDVYVRDVLPALAPRERSRRRREIINALARLVALAHTSGIDHNDLHTGNVLIRWPQDDHEAPLPQLYLIDLPGIRLTGPLNWRRSRDSLAMLGGSCLFRVSRIDRWRFWRMYVSERREALAVFPDHASQEIWRCMQAHAERVVAARDKRCLRNNRDFQRITTTAAVAWRMRSRSFQPMSCKPLPPILAGC
jgi:hypothetical protein